MKIFEPQKINNFIDIIKATFVNPLFDNLILVFLNTDWKTEIAISFENRKLPLEVTESILKFEIQRLLALAD